mmetsp:Transcript_25520/g.37671  ORF Transcript_25520/g.37671 Transcript_25520/m.37671 type:complete len:531 (-) Transcript_25520:145-1737(-)|eukprot:CAMPEP_0185025104 /NCGR_PEP_ID=MMETSP1103-20130426/8188_1 /TAXON_ID=36769 /ORGANISM="Paraphysomonas bandaiensis, Strain Caron Lab Isolate" /LENGTH=530 /DNA_ID=CAMNT_0027558227 /DNA_START=93 /DNA_END=1685 /DNA_ORIENTATION=+
MSAPSTEEQMEMGALSEVKLHTRPRDDELRVLIFTACYFVLDGVTLTIRRLEAHLRARGAVVKIASTVPDEFTEEQTKDIIIIPGIKIPFTAAGEGYAFGGSLGANTLREIEEFNPNCVHFTVPDLVSLDGIRWCQRNNVGYMATWHSNYSDYLKYYFLEWVLKPGFMVYLKGFYEQMPAVYVPTPFMLDKLKREGFGKNTQLLEWGRGVDLKLFTPDRRSSEFRASRGISEQDVLVLWVGRLVPEKRPDIWTNVMQRLHSEGINAKGIVVGHGTFETTLSQMPNVSCAGWLSGVALAEAYASADILLFPSDVETFGNVTLEALASGCVSVVVNTCSGHLVQNGFNGYTCAPGDLEGFYQATKNLVQDDKLRRQMSKNARESAWRFERNKILQQMAENYKDAIVRHRNPEYVRELMATPHGQGRTFLSYICCNFWFVKTFAEPFLNATASVQTLADSSKECMNSSRSQFTCGKRNMKPSVSSTVVKFADEGKERLPASAPFILLMKTMNYTAIIASYLIIGLLIYASFTL